MINEILSQMPEEITQIMAVTIPIFLALKLMSLFLKALTGGKMDPIITKNTEEEIIGDFEEIECEEEEERPYFNDPITKY